MIRLVSVQPIARSSLCWRRSPTKAAITGPLLMVVSRAKLAASYNRKPLPSPTASSAPSGVYAARLTTAGGVSGRGVGTSVNSGGGVIAGGFLLWWVPRRSAGVLWVRYHDGRTEEQVGEWIGADRMLYQSLEDLIEAAMLGALNETVFARLWRQRHRHMPYLGKTLRQLDAAGRYALAARLCRAVAAGSRWPMFQRMLDSYVARGLIAAPPEDLLAKKPEAIIEKAVKGMLPKGPMGRKLFKNLKVYAGAEHPHAAQKPVTIE